MFSRYPLREKRIGSFLFPIPTFGSYCAQTPTLRLVSGISLIPMTNAEMHAIQIQNTPVRLQRTLAPDFKLVGEALVEATNRAGTGSHSHERLGHFSYLMSARPGDKHLGEPFCNVGFIPTVAFEGLGVELTFTVPGHFDLLEPTSGGHQIARVVTVAIAFALGATLSPGRSNELIELSTHHRFDHDPNGALGERTQVL
jgi:hypothetical protein